MIILRPEMLLLSLIVSYITRLFTLVSGLVITVEYINILIFVLKTKVDILLNELKVIRRENFVI